MAIKVGKHVAVTLVSLSAAGAVAADGLSDAFANAEAHLDLRLRYEYVEVDPAAGSSVDSEGTTLRSRLNLKTGAFRGFTGFVEMDDVTALGDVDHSDAVNGKPGPGIADPEGTEVNQVWVAYANWNSEARWGRQRIAYDNHRFIGNVGWRQNEQTYDAFSIANKSVAGLALSYAHVDNVNRIFGEGSAVGDAEMDSHLLNIHYKAGGFGGVTAYAYLLENEDSFAGFNRWNTDTYGLRWSNTLAFEAVSFDYTVEYATQSDGDDNPSSYDADYLHGELSVGVKPVKVTLGIESLGADDVGGQFITPLATLFKFQGWTDQFLNLGQGNIAEGIVDSYLSVVTTLGRFKFLLVYHDFESDEDNAAGDSDLGSEIGGLIARQWGPYGVELRYASYDAGDSTPFNGGGLMLSDTEKAWVTFTAAF